MNEMDGACGRYAGFGGPNLTQTDQLELTGLLGRIIFKQTFRKQNWKKWA